MTKQDYIEKIKQSQLSDEAKQQVLALLESGELSFDVREKIKDIIQADIDADMEGVLDEEDDSEIKEATKELETDLAKIEEELNADMAFVEEELGKVEKMTQDLDKAMDEKEIEDIKAGIAEQFAIKQKCLPKGGFLFFKKKILDCVDKAIYRCYYDKNF